MNKITPLLILLFLTVPIISCVNRPVSARQTSIDPTPNPKAKNTNSPAKIVLKSPRPGKEYSRLGAPLTNFTSANFVGSANCSMCHEELEDSEGNDISISNHWRATMMANAAKDPFWQAKVKSEAQRHPSHAKEIEEKCTRCHMPMAWLQAQDAKKEFELASSTTLLDHLLNPNSMLHETALDGVSCSLCHQIQPDGLATTKSYSGKFTIDTSTSAPDRLIFGPYPEVYQKTMMTFPGYSPVYGGHIRESAICATCHTLYTPYLDTAGNVQGEFPEQTVFLEWLQSVYGKPTANGLSDGSSNKKSNGKIRTCQDCHMPETVAGELLIAKPAHKNVKAKNHFGKHDFIGGNVLMLNILHDHIVPLKITASSRDIKATRDRTLKQLQANTASVSIQNLKKSRNKLTTVIQIENMVGHKFPTGFPSRRTWIHFTVFDGTGENFFESGQPLLDGRIIGDDSEEQRGYEPHYNLISNSDQVQIYESVMRNTEGQVTYTVMSGAGYLKDNRLLPYGFNNKAASPDIRVTGQADQDRNFIGGSDQVTYTVDIGTHPGPYTIQAELLYTSISHPFMTDLGQDDNLSLVKRFQQYYDNADLTPITVAVAQQTIK